MRGAVECRFDVVIVSALDRVARSTKHFLSVVDELDGLGMEFVSRRENIATDGPMGGLFLTVTILYNVQFKAGMLFNRVLAVQI